MQRAHSLEKTLILGKIDGRRRRGWQRKRRLDGITDSMDLSLNKLHKTEPLNNNNKDLKEFPYIHDVTTSVLGSSSLKGCPCPLSGYASLS